MTLTGRFSALFLVALGLVLAAVSTALYVSARVYLDRQLGDRSSAALAVLSAAAEVHPEGVEWEPRERVIPIGQESGADRLRWMVFDDRGVRIDRSPNLDDRELTPAWTPRPSTSDLPSRLSDRRGRPWRISQHRIRSEEASNRPTTAGSPADPAPTEPFPPYLVLTVCAPIGPMEATLRTLAGALLALGGGAWLLAALLCRRISRKALTPLSRLAESARGLNPADPGWSLPMAGTGDELDDLGRAFNDLLARLHVAYERQRRFGADASHQLRTPLTVLIGQIEVALRQDRPAEEYRRVLRSALGRAVQLGQIVEALLFLGRADADAPLPEVETLELDTWVADHLAIRTSPPLAGEIRYHAGEGATSWVRVHPPLLGQLLDNLLDNAAKHGRPGAPILVETSREADSVVLAVEDSGPGIPSGDLPRVFEPFYRSAEARRRGVSGVGLGLAVVQRIASAFGGVAAVRSEPGKGCRFEIRLPGTAPPPGAAEPADAVPTPEELATMPSGKSGVE